MEVSGANLLSKLSKGRKVLDLTVMMVWCDLHQPGSVKASVARWYCVVVSDEVGQEKLFVST